MREPGHPRAETPAESRQGAIALGALGFAVLLIAAAAVVGVAIGMPDGAHRMMGDAGARGPAPQADARALGLDMVPAHMVQHYELARANPEVYAQVPCFCGCQAMLGHRNLQDCFVTPDGAWESHAAGCQICIQESRMLMRMMGRGMGPGLMAERVIAEFGGSKLTT